MCLLKIKYCLKAYMAKNYKLSDLVFTNRHVFP